MWPAGKAFEVPLYFRFPDLFGAQETADLLAHPDCTDDECAPSASSLLLQSGPAAPLPLTGLTFLTRRRCHKASRCASTSRPRCSRRDGHPHSRSSIKTRWIATIAASGIRHLRFSTGVVTCSACPRRSLRTPSPVDGCTWTEFRPSMGSSSDCARCGLTRIRRHRPADSRRRSSGCRWPSSRTTHRRLYVTMSGNRQGDIHAAIEPADLGPCVSCRRS